MTKTYKIYPIGNQEPLTLFCSKIAIIDNEFVVYDIEGKNAKDSFLVFNQVAAIVPDQTQPLKNPRTFYVHLKKRTKPVVISAHSFKLDAFRITFLERTYDVAQDVTSERDIEGIYIAKSEVIAVLPDDGVRS